MANPHPESRPRNFTKNAIISFVILFVFCMLLMLWHGSCEIDKNGNLHYNTRVVEPSSDY